MKTKIRDFVLSSFLFVVYISYLLVFFSSYFKTWIVYFILFSLFLLYYNKAFIKDSYIFLKQFFKKKKPLELKQVTIDIFSDFKNEPKKEQQKKKPSIIVELIKNPKIQEFIKNPKVIKVLIHLGIGFLLYFFTAFIYCTYRLTYSLYNFIF